MPTIQNKPKKSTMSKPKSTITIKLLVDASKRKVVFAEAGKECVDFFFHILSMPLANVVKFLTKESMAGSIGTLYGSLEKLDTDFFQDGFDKESLLYPEPPAQSAPQVPFLYMEEDRAATESDEDDSSESESEDDLGAKTMYICSGAIKSSMDCYSNVHLYVSDTAGSYCPKCKRKMTTSVPRVDPPAVDQGKAQSSSLGGYVKGVVTYMIMDDLSIEPMSAISGIDLLNKFNVQDLRGLEKKVVNLDMKLGVALLKASLTSNTVLTDVFLRNKAFGSK